MARAQTDVVILDGRRGGEMSADPAFKALTDEIASRGLPCRVFDLRAMPIGACNACFGCWVKTPGQCVQDDPAREVTRACARADLVVLFTPVTFGGYSSELKKSHRPQPPQPAAHIRPYPWRDPSPVALHHSPRQAAGVVLAADSPERLRAAAAGLLDRVLGRGDRR